MVGNDDGISNIGIDALASEAKRLGNVVIICPEKQQSGRAKSMTFHKPIRFFETETVSGHHAYAYNSTPADSIIIYKHLFGRPDVVLSGINSGDNTTIHSVLTSGTVAVAMEAGLLNVPSFAFSMDVPEEFFFKDSFPGELKLASKIAVNIAETFLRYADATYWENCLFINVNFPDHIDTNPEVVVVELETWKYENYLVEREDPKGEKYYWLWGTKREDYDRTKDSYNVFVNKKITITPVTFGKSVDLFEETNEIMNKFNFQSD
jgi:5'-nucleotidase